MAVYVGISGSLWPESLAGFESDYPFRTRLAKEGKGDKWWNYTDSELKNLEIIDNVIFYISKYALPIINGFKNDTGLLERVKISDIKNRFIHRYQTLKVD